MSWYGDAFDNGTGIGWIGQGLKKAGVTGGSFGEMMDASNRGAAAEAGPYGGINRNNFNVPGYAGASRQYGQMASQYGNRPTQYSDFRGNQQGLGRQLANEAAGNGVGQQMVRMQARGMADRGMQQQYGMAAGARPGQGALASRQAAMNAGNINAQVGGQSAMGAGQVTLGAQGQYGQFLQGARSADEDTRLKQLGLNDQSQLEALRQRLQLQGMQQQGGQAYEANRTNRFNGMLGVPTQGEQWLGAARDLGSMATRGG